MIVTRYLTRQLYSTILVVTAVLLLIFICNQFIRYLAKAAAGKISGLIVLKIIALQIPTLLGLLLPVGVFLGTILAYGRLYVDNEMTVLSSCGFGKAQLIRVTLFASLVLMLLSGFLTLWVTPQLRAWQTKLQAISQAELLVTTIMPGRFQMAGDDQQVYYVENVDRDNNQVQNIFVARQEKSDDNDDHGQAWSVTSAETGYQQMNPADGEQFIVAVNGTRYSGVPGSKNFRIIHFKKFGMRLDDKTPEIRYEHASWTNQDLFQKRKNDPLAMAELQWRIAVPLSIPCLALMAIPLSFVPPRRGRFAHILPAILLYTVFANMMFVTKGWIETNILAPYPGIIWLHLIIISCASFLMIDKALWFDIRQRLTSWVRT